MKDLAASGTNMCTTHVQCERENCQICAELLSNVTSWLLSGFVEDLNMLTHTQEYNLSDSLEGENI